MAEGHRKRIREKIVTHGTSSLTDAELLEYILYPFIPRKDTSKLAQTLLEDFGDLQGVMTATPKELIAYKDLTESASLFLPLIPEFYSRAVSRNILGENSVMSPYVIKRYLYSMLAHWRQEKFLMTALDRDGRFIKSKMVGEGDSSRVSMSRKTFLDFIESTKPYQVAIGHNHPFSDAYPSQDDLDITRELVDCAKTVGVEVVDHVIAGTDTVFSFREQGIMDKNILENTTEQQVREQLKLTKINDKLLSEAD